MGTPSMLPWDAFTAALRDELGADYKIPAFDPKDGGIDARALFLLEAPSPKAVASGLVSQDNPELSARNMKSLLAEAGFERREVVLWNIVPWYVGDGRRIRPVRRSDIQQALPHLRGLLGLLKRLQVIVVVGRKAQAARADIAEFTAVPIASSYHTSNLVLNRSPSLRDEILASFQIARLAAV